MERKINMASFLMPYNSACIKGIAALCIMLGHYLSSFPWYVGGWLHGYLWVGIFFFYSGYGLRRSVETKENYLENFWKHKFRTVLCPYMFAAGAAALFYYLNKKIVWYELVLGPILGFQYNKTLWYVVELLVIYILFYLVQSYWAQSLEIIMCVSYVVLVVLGVLFDIGTWWYISTSTFLMGTMSEYVYDFLNKVKVGRRSLMVAFAFLYAVIIMNEARIIVFPWKETYIITFIQMISVPLFTLMMMCLKFDFEKWGMALVKLLSKISYEVYLWHMLILWINQSWGGISIITYMISVLETIVWAMVLNWCKRKRIIKV